MEKVCEKCGKRYTDKKSGRQVSRFCSRPCRQAARHVSGVDDETRLCRRCGKAFRTNRYSRVVRCSRSCAVDRCERVDDVVLPDPLEEEVVT